MMQSKWKLSGLAALPTALLTALPAWAQEATEAVTEAAAEVVEAAPVSGLDTGDTAWMITATALVMFMILPGLALFYGGLVRAKNMLSVLVQVTAIAAMMMIIWVFYGYSFAFGGSDSAYFGGFDKIFLKGVTAQSESGTIPEYLFIAFQMTFAALTPALIVGAFAERIKFGALMVFSVLWATLVYFPIAHMAWDPNGLFFGWEVLDFAGGTVVHINAGVAGLVGALVLGKRTGYGKDNMAPHSLPLAITGAGMLWVGWFGFNAGSALGASTSATLAMLNTFTATAGATVAWLVLEKLFRSKSSALGAASGIIAGLVAVTPAAGAVGPVGAIILGAAGSAVAYYFVSVVKVKAGYDDSLDVFGIHGVAGILGAIGTGILASPSFGGQGFGGEHTMASQVYVQALAVIITIIWCALVSYVLFKLIDKVMGLRVSVDAEREGLDLTSHGERAYHS
ncbi:ammonium transporter [Xinfangfangia sp. CPCC 101601]|uniref:Ammonium transporter n=2 Tax=Pseudogemmobacter lacusdianii TaxID=3069608 RepID=A0ABU0VYM5_9RHOB|nr:ammonium transporter [Xinfangfangia sp. CPCC 101601]MDQ2066861.1 ammonium transporter [Xinfangfangia sp. CPCC 101601]